MKKFFSRRQNNAFFSKWQAYIRLTKQSYFLQKYKLVRIIWNALLEDIFFPNECDVKTG